MPLTEKVSFKTVLQRGNRVQVPRRIRWRFKMDSMQVFLKVTLTVVGLFTGYQSFYTQMGRDGRITVPTLQRALLKDEYTDSLDHHVIEVTLEPA